MISPVQKAVFAAVQFGQSEEASSANSCDLTRLIVKKAIRVRFKY